MTDDDLPPLPGPRLTNAGDVPERGHYFAADQVRDYARAAIAHFIARQKPVAFEAVFSAENWMGGITGDAELAARWKVSGITVVPLYRLDGGGDAESV